MADDSSSFLNNDVIMTSLVLLKIINVLTNSCFYQTPFYLISFFRPMATFDNFIYLLLLFICLFRNIGLALE